MSEKNLTLGDLATRVQRAVGDDDTTVLTYIKQWINNRYFDVLSREAWPFTMVPSSTIVYFGPGMYETPLPEDFRQEVIVYDSTNDKMLYKKSLEWIRNNDPDNDSTCTVATGTQYYYYPKDGIIAIHPKVASTESSSYPVNIDYTADPQPLIQTSDIPLLPNRFRALILVSGAIADYYNWKENYNGASNYENRYEKAIGLLGIEQGIYDAKGDEEVIMSWEDA